jgi:predicted kinase
MSELIMMVGVAGSGKSTLAKHLAASIGAEIVSSDAVRGELYGDESCQANHAKVFEVVHNRIRSLLKEHKDVIYDATNLNAKRRMNFLKDIGALARKKTCIVVVTTPEDVAIRMKLRDRKVPMEVVHKQLCQFQCPNYYEGWDSIGVEYNSASGACHDSCSKLWKECDIPHDNPHHTLSIKEHMDKAADIAEALAWKTEGLSLVQERWIAHIHDVGKARTKSFTDRDGNPSEVAHYIGHQNYGAYYSLIFDGADFDISTKESLDNACLIQWHMEHYLRNEQGLKKFYEMIGPKLERRLRVLEKADRAAH